MTKYKVKNMLSDSATSLQMDIEKWVKITDHIEISSMNIWNVNNMTYATIIYTENEYNL